MAQISSTTGKARTKVATVKEVKSLVGGLTEEFLRCRDLGHIWMQFKVKKVRGGFERSLFCKSCKTNKHQFVSGKGEILASTYSYTEGYEFHGVGRIHADGKAVLRLEALSRSPIIEEEEAE